MWQDSVNRPNDLGVDLHLKTIFQILGLPANGVDDLVVSDKQLKAFFDCKPSHSFELEVLHPGLIVGSGYTHPSVNDFVKALDKCGGDKADPDKERSSSFMLGFHFDHTTGLPVIPGSTVKGVLKAAFPKADGKLDTGKLEYIDQTLKNVWQPPPGQSTPLTAENWEQRIFPPGDRFYDAYICGVPTDGKIFAEDHICPHRKDPDKACDKDIFRDPVPVRFLKIAPEVRFRFQFLLTDTAGGAAGGSPAVIPTEVRRKLFRQILLDWGIGAKRNLGYGSLGS
jgi:CRISPR-associated protein Cmr6